MMSPSRFRRIRPGTVAVSVTSSYSTLSAVTVILSCFSTTLPCAVAFFWFTPSMRSASNTLGPSFFRFSKLPGVGIDRSGRKPSRIALSSSAWVGVVACCAMASRLRPPTAPEVAYAPTSSDTSAREMGENFGRCRCGKLSGKLKGTLGNKVIKIDNGGENPCCAADKVGWVIKFGLF